MPICIPCVLPRFRLYLHNNPSWGSLHIVLADGNVSDKDVNFCFEWATRHDDPEGAELAKILLKMSKTQRMKIGVIA